VVAEYERRKAEFCSDAGVWKLLRRAKAGCSRLSPLGRFYGEVSDTKTHTRNRSNNLPWGHEAVTRAPYTVPRSFKTSRLFGETGEGGPSGSVSGISLPNAALPPPTPRIGRDRGCADHAGHKDLAGSLNNQRWRFTTGCGNSIQFVPSYGSIQGSDMTLQTKRGNSFDTEAC